MSDIPSYLNERTQHVLTGNRKWFWQKVLSLKREDMTKEVMNLIDDCTGQMQCKVCGAVHIAQRTSDGKYDRESLWCIHGCRLEDAD